MAPGPDGPADGIAHLQFSTLSSIVRPAPVECLVFIEEREDSINDGCFQIDMGSFDPVRPSADVLVDYPADRHEGAGTMSFADGHVEAWRWADPRTRVPVRFGQSLPLNIPSPANPDVTRIQLGASRKINGSR